MQRHRILAAILAAATVFAASAAQAQRAPAEVQKSYDAFIGDFRKALKSNDASNVGKLTKFPVLVRSDLHDEAWFRKNAFAKVFTAKIRACIDRGKGVYQRDGAGTDGFSIFCGDEIFLFNKTPDGFRFAEVGAND